MNKDLNKESKGIESDVNTDNKKMSLQEPVKMQIANDHMGEIMPSKSVNKEDSVTGAEERSIIVSSNDSATSAKIEKKEI